MIETSTGPVASPRPIGPRRLALPILALAVVYTIALFVFWRTARNGGWALVDTTEFHLPTINHYLAQGIDLKFAENWLAMFPGYHVWATEILRPFGVAELTPTSPSGFLLQTVAGLVLFASLFRIAAARAASGADVAVILLPVLSSSYVIFSWCWVTTDIASIALYALMIALAFAPASFGNAVVEAFLVLFALLVRQNNAALGAAPLARVVWRFVRPGGGRPTRLDWIAAGLGLAAAIVGVAWLWLLWGGLTPPGYRKHSSEGLNLVAGAHVVALAGIVGWPFAVTLFRNLVADRRSLVVVLVFSLVLALVCTAIVPAESSHESGRFGSVVWTVIRVLKAPLLGHLFLFGSSLVGAFLFFSAIRLAFDHDEAPQELILFFLTAATQVAQTLSFQRYVEPYLFVSFGVFATRLRRDRLDHALIFGWYGLYLAVSIGKFFVGGGGDAAG